MKFSLKKNPVAPTPAPAPVKTYAGLTSNEIAKVAAVSVVSTVVGVVVSESLKGVGRLTLKGFEKLGDWAKESSSKKEEAKKEEAKKETSEVK